MSPEEVLIELQNMGIKTSRSTLLRFEKAGLIPEPIHGAGGRGVGRFTDYPECTPRYFYASWLLLKTERLSVKDLAKAFDLVAKNDKERDLDKLIRWERRKQNIDKDVKEEDKTRSLKLYSRWQEYCIEANDQKIIQLLTKENKMLKEKIERLKKMINITPK